MSDSDEDSSISSVDSIEENIIDQVLEWIGFTQPQRNRLTQEFDSTDDIREWTDKDVNLSLIHI